MNKQFPWKFSLIAFVILAAAYSFWPPQEKIKLGLDLKGGTSFLLKMDLSQIDAAGKGQAIRQAIEILERRINKFGVSEPIIQSVGSGTTEDRILVQLPGLTEAARTEARRTIEQTAYLEFLLVHADNDRLQAESGSPYFHAPLGYTNLTQDVKGSEGQAATRHFFCKLKPEQGLTGKYVERAYVTYDELGRPNISLTFNKDGATLFGRVTGANVGRQLAIVLDGEVRSAPVIQDAILGGRAQISGTFSITEAQRLASVLENPLQAPVKVLEQRSVDPSLGLDSIHSGIRSALYGAIAVIAFMAIYYLLAGMVANAALVLNILITVGVLAMFKFTLTLPGIAGIVLSIGMAVDTNVLIYERVREELAANKPLRAAISAAYSRAFRVIFDAHFTAILTAVILIWMGSGPVKGFGVTLVIGLLANLFSGVFVTRVIFDWLVAKGIMKQFTMLHIFKGVAHINFLGVWKIAFLLSWLLIAAGMVTFVKRGGHRLGQDTALKLSCADQVATDQVMQRLKDIGISASRIEYRTGPDAQSLLLLTLPSSKAEAVTPELQKVFPKAQFKLVSSQGVMGEVYGIDFKGGDTVTLGFAKHIEADAIRNSLTEAGHTESYLQYQHPLGGGTEVLEIKLPEGQSTAVVKYLQEKFPDAQFTSLGTESVGEELLQQALIAMGVSLLAIMVYIALRFGEFSYGLGALISLIHDVLMTVGWFCLTGRTFSMPVVAAVLTLIGYSINDTIVVYDRIRENRKLTGGKLNYFDLINRSVNETLSRTILTAGTVFLCSVALYGFGGRVLNDFAFCFLVGVLTGTYSSIYIASPCVLWYHRSDKK